MSASIFNEIVPYGVIIGTPGAKRLEMNRAECLAISWLIEHAASDLAARGRIEQANCLKFAAARWRLTAEIR
jgi:hypothetical protein